MARKALCLSPSSCVAVLVITSLVAVSSAAPLPLSVAIGIKILEYAIDEVFPNDISTTLTSELEETQFHEVVCPLFAKYGHLNLTLQLLSQNDTRYAHVSLITFLTNKATQSSCNYVKNACSGEQECSRMSCSISSISTLCLEAFSTDDLPSLSRRISSRRLPGLMQMWMRNNISDRDLENGVFDRLSSVLFSATTIRCSVPECPSVEYIVCDYDF